ncbi:MAG: hypothetical protein M3452_08145, partial [Chloroflexota bacterium]|nr:hypothetical protein [Chloroflexota bacterium]
MPADTTSAARSRSLVLAAAAAVLVGVLAMGLLISAQRPTGPDAAAVPTPSNRPSSPSMVRSPLQSHPPASRAPS